MGIVPSSPPAAQSIEPTAAAFGNLVAAIYGMQKQIDDLSVRMSFMEGRQPSLQQSYRYGLPGSGGIPALPAPGLAISELFAVPPFQPPQHTSTTPTLSSIASPSMSGGIPITQILCPHSPSPFPTMSSIMGSAHPPTQPPTAHYTAAQPYVPEPANPIVPRYQKLEFPTYDGKDDPLWWLNKCEQFFRAQQTCHATDWVWLASFHLNGVTQQRYLVLESDCGRPTWEDFQSLCHQRFGPPLSTNHLSDLARLPFTSTAEAYMEAF